ncbi:uncharacterized protein LOC113864824 isoform X2 [Abrus precatorius]|uniref:Uncharacterized protein LOC113864824 isoform X2 n=1 Tax=Abrus precatorius TaxID=3816 RepID=A0A8B8LEK2_ABRPR|nr:uncharacterized protein LOC113864824 isoform X2 [Abrus precatorius]
MIVVKSEIIFSELSVSMSRKLYDQLKSEKFSLSYADHSREIKRSEEDSTLKSYRNQHKHGNYGRENEEDELVKYMSKLPCYLERGKPNREKVLNVGVLDWGRLEQWQYCHKHVSHKSGRNSTSSSVSTDELPGNASRGRSCYPSDQRIFHTSLQSHLMASPMQGHSQAFKSSRESVANCQNFRGSHGNIDTQSKYVRPDDHLSPKQPKSKLKRSDRKYLDPYVDKESGIFPNDQMHGTASCARLGIFTQNGALGKRVETLKEPNIGSVVHVTPRKSKPDVYFPRDHPRNTHCGVPHTPTLKDHPRNSHCGVPPSRTSLVQTAENYSRMSFTEKPKELCPRDIHYDISHSSLPLDELSCDHSQRKESGCSSMDLESIKLPASTFSSPMSTLSSPLSVKMGVSPSRCRKDEERKQAIAKNSSANGPLLVLDQKVTSEKSRSSSPFHRLSFSIGYSSKGSSSKEVEHLPHQNSVAALKSSSENVRGYAYSSNDKLSDTGRSRSSPLRRLLDPLLKSKTAKSRHSLELSQKDSVLLKDYRPANGKLSTLQPDKEVDKGHRVGCSQVNTIDSLKEKKCVPSMTQALLRIAVRNGMPFFTFAVDHTDSNILAATVKNLGALEKDECNCIYTFFTFKEVKKKNGSWMNQAGRSRSKGPDYIPHVVAQMKVSDSHNYDLTSRNCMDSSTVKEFVLFSLKLEQDDAQRNDYQLNDELAAIVVKIPKAINFINDQHQSSCQSDGQDHLQATVVLPGGIHSLPSKGGPSSLIQRWKSGGSCDCGGWDLACKLKILASENQACRKPKSSKAYFVDQLDLFVQGNEQELPPAFTFTHFKHGIYSIAFDSSLSLLQAFSICIALVESKMSYELSGSRNSIEGKNTRETLLVQSRA